jgi:excinuclease ABC subunit C
MLLSEPPADNGENGEDQLQPQRQLPLLRLLTAIQDEAHRFAGQYRRKLSQKRHTRFTLEGIPGIGPSRRRLLLAQFQTIKGVSEASLASLQP